MSANIPAFVTSAGISKRSRRRARLVNADVPAVYSSLTQAQTTYQQALGVMRQILSMSVSSGH